MDVGNENEIVDAKSQFSVENIYLSNLRRRNKPQMFRQFILILLLFYFTFTIPLTAERISYGLQYYAPFFILIVIAGIDFYWILPNAILRDMSAGVMSLIATTSITDAEILGGIIKWITPQSLYHLLPLMLLLLGITMFSGGVSGGVINILLIVVCASQWYIMLGTGIISVFQHEAHLNRGVIYAGSLIFLMVLYLLSMFITAIFYGEWVFIFIFSNDENIIMTWLGVWAFIILISAMGTCGYLNRTMKFWRRSL